MRSFIAATLQPSLPDPCALQDDGGNDLFVHHTAIAGEGFKSLSEGAKVQYEVGEGAKGPAAENVSPV